MVHARHILCNMRIPSNHWAVHMKYTHQEKVIIMNDISRATELIVSMNVIIFYVNNAIIIMYIINFIRITHPPLLLQCMLCD